MAILKSILLHDTAYHFNKFRPITGILEESSNVILQTWSKPIMEKVLGVLPDPQDQQNGWGYHNISQNLFISYHTLKL